MTGVNSSQDQLEFSGEVDLARLKSKVLDLGPREMSFARLDDLDAHLGMVAQEFSGRPAILFYNAWLIVHLRRFGAEHWPAFQRLWATEAQYLVDELDSRWLVSACDTFIDMSENAEDVGHALAATLLAATVKLHETERLLDRPDVNRRRPRWLGGQARHRLPPGKTDLFDGLTAYSVGHGDLMRNLADRIARVTGRSDRPTALILREVFRRMHAHDTVFRRFRDVHSNPKTHWTP